MALDNTQGPSRDTVFNAISTSIQSVNPNNEPEYTLETQPPIPSDDFTLENDTEDSARAIQMTRQALLNELDGEVSFQSRNSQLPLFKLPTELLVEILALSLSHNGRQGARRYFKDILGLSHVCELWRYIINGTPRFLVHIHSAAGPKVERQLSRAGNLPLSLRYHGNKDGNIARRFIQQSLTYVTRWKSLELYCNGDEFGVIGALLESVEMDGVEKVILESAGAIPYTPIFRFGGGQGLQTLVLRGVVLSSDSGGEFHSLTRLEITGVILPTPRCLPDLLKLCDRVKDLHLESVFAGWLASEPPLAPTEITMRELTSITLGDWLCDRRAWAPVFQRIHAPSLQELLVVDTEPDGLGVMAYPVTASVQPTLLQTILHNVHFTALEISAQRDMFCLKGSTQSTQKTQYQPDEGLAHLNLSFCKPSLSALHCLSHISFQSVPIFLEIDDVYHPSVLKHLPSTVSLAINGTENGVLRYLEFLSRPKDSNGWISPDLEQLHLRFNNETSNSTINLSPALQRKIRLLIKNRLASPSTNAEDSSGAGRELRVWINDRKFVVEKVEGSIQTEPAADWVFDVEEVEYFAQTEPAATEDWDFSDE